MKLSVPGKREALWSACLVAGLVAASAVAPPAYGADRVVLAEYFNATW